MRRTARHVEKSCLLTAYIFSKYIIILSQRENHAKLLDNASFSDLGKILSHGGWRIERATLKDTRRECGRRLGGKPIIFCFLMFEFLSPLSCRAFVGGPLVEKWLSLGCEDCVAYMRTLALKLYGCGRGVLSVPDRAAPSVVSPGLCFTARA